MTKIVYYMFYIITILFSGPPSRRESEFKKPSHAPTPQNGRVHHRPHNYNKVKYIPIIIINTPYLYISSTDCFAWPNHCKAHVISHPSKKWSRITWQAMGVSINIIYNTYQVITDIIYTYAYSIFEAWMIGIYISRIDVRFLFSERGAWFDDGGATPPTASTPGTQRLPTSGLFTFTYIFHLISFVRLYSFDFSQNVVNFYIHLYWKTRYSIRAVFRQRSSSISECLCDG